LFVNDPLLQQININKDIIINNMIELVQAVYSACVQNKTKNGGKEFCRKMVGTVVQNGMNVIFDTIELTNHMLMKGVKLGTPQAKQSLASIAMLLAGKKSWASPSNLGTVKPPRRHRN